MNDMTSNGFTISKTFKDLIPRLAKEELAQLEENVCRDGCRDPLVVWKEEQILLDGHTRFEICSRHGLAYKTKELSFPDRDAAKEWVIRNQFGRRNLAPYQRAELAFLLEPIIASRAKENQGKRTDIDQKSDRSSKRTNEALAKIAGVSHDTIHKARVVSKKADEETKAKLRRGEGKSLNAVHTEIARREKLQVIHEKAKAEAKAAPPDDVVNDLKDAAGTFRAVYMDPPWGYEDDTARGVAAGHYPTMTPAKLARLPVGELAHKDGCHFWIWTTWPKVRDKVIHEVIEAWGLTWVGEVVWDKQKIGTGRWLRSQTEILVLAVKGKIPLLHADQANFLSAPRSTRHSEKPEDFRQLVERLSPEPRIELFSRHKAEGWKRWGLES